jgi:hypothetical protein
LTAPPPERDPRRVVPGPPIAPTLLPAPFRDLGDAEDIALSDAGGLTQFGAFPKSCIPAAQTSLRHWHEEEDEFLYVLDGTVTLLENDGPRPDRPRHLRLLACRCAERPLPAQ